MSLCSSRRRLLSSAAVACSLAGLLALSLPAQAQTPLTWSGSGTSGFDPYGHTWLYNNNTGTEGWGVPGVLNGISPWLGPDQLLSFTVTFTALPGGVSITTPNTVGSLSTRFANVTSNTFWTASASANSVTFTAPIGGELNPGNTFFGNVTFIGDPADSPFTVDYNGGLVAVPETGTFALLGLGVLPFAGMIVRRRKS